jgi:DNA polymerase III subunit delta
MVALKAAEVDSFVARPSPERPIVLVCGPDAGLVHERAEKIIKASVDDLNDPFALVRIEGDALSSDPSRLVEEAHTVPLFGGRRAVWVKAGSRNFAAAVEAVVASPPTDCRIVIEAGDLRRTAPVRAICEKAKCAAVLPCYVDTERDLIRLVDDEMRDARLSIAPDARAALVSLIGGDRQASRSEIRKLALYAHGKERVTLDDVVAVVADASALALDAVVDAAFAGRAPDTESQFSKALSAGTSSGTIMSWALRYVTQLHKARVALDVGEDTYAAMRSFIPPIHFRREAMVQTALKAWTAPRLERAMGQLAEAALNVRRTAALSDALAQRALLSLAVSARRR